MIKERSGREVFETWTESQKRLWEGLSTVMPAFRKPQGMEAWQETYMRNLSAWEKSVQDAMAFQATWMKQWAGRVIREKGTPEAMADWNRQAQEVMDYWLETQNKLWEGWFELLRSGEGRAAPKPASTAGETGVVAPEPVRKESAPAAPSPPPAAQAPAAQAPAARERRDDLKLISGVGPALEAKLNEQGIRTFRQIAELRDEDIDRLDESFGRFAGRIRRDDWIGQAREQHRLKYNEVI